MKRTALVFFLAVYTVMFFLLLPGYRFVFDQDAIGYLKIAERVAAGDYARSVNGLWSPLNAWLIVPFLKAGFDAVTVAKYLNGVLGCCSLVAVFYLLKKFLLHKYAQVGIMTTITVLLLYYTFHELFADLLLLMMLIIYLNIICSAGFIRSNTRLAGCGLLCAVGFYTKAYFFYFSAIHLAVVIFILLKKELPPFKWSSWFFKTSLAVGTMIIAIVPWIIQLTAKYGRLTISNAGQFNQTFMLSQAYQQPKVPIFGPHYPDGYSFWDDPSYFQVTHINAFTNKTVFIQQLKLIVSNIFEAIRNLNNFSFLSMAVIIAVLMLAFTKNNSFLKSSNNILLLSVMLLFPLGYILIRVEPRYLWFLNIILILFAGIILTMLNQSGLMKKNLLAAATFVCFGSFCLHPLNQLQDQYNEGRDVYDIAAAFKKNELSGKFLYDAADNKEATMTVVLSYLLKSQDYGLANHDLTQEQIFEAIKANKIDYYVQYYQHPSQKQMILASEMAKRASAVFPDVYPGIVVLSYK